MNTLDPSQKNILVVEDDPKVVEAMRREIEKHPGVTATFVATATGARQLLLQNIVFHAISIDAQFPEYKGAHKTSQNTSGIELLFFLDVQEIHQGSTVVFYSHNTKALARAGNMCVNGKQVVALNKTEHAFNVWIEHCLPSK